MNVSDIRRLVSEMLAPLRSGVRGMVARAVVTEVDDSKKLQTLKLSLTDEDHEDVERFQQYGLTSVPAKDSEAVVVFVGGVRDHPLVTAVDDRSARLLNLESGEVAVYSSSGSKIVLKSNGDIEMTPGGTGVIKINGALTATGEITAHSSTVPIGLSSHKHSGVTTGAGTSGAPVT